MLLAVSFGWVLIGWLTQPGWWRGSTGGYSPASPAASDGSGGGALTLVIPNPHTTSAGALTTRAATGLLLVDNRRTVTWEPPTTFPSRRSTSSWPGSSPAARQT